MTEQEFLEKAEDNGFDKNVVSDAISLLSNDYNNKWVSFMKSVKPTIRLGQTSYLRIYKLIRKGYNLKAFYLNNESEIHKKLKSVWYYKDIHKTLYHNQEEEYAVAYLSELICLLEKHKTWGFDRLHIENFGCPMTIT